MSARSAPWSGPRRSQLPARGGSSSALEARRTNWCCQRDVKKIYYGEQVRTGRRELALATMYKRRAGSGTGGRRSDAIAPELTSETLRAGPENNVVHPPEEDN